MRLEQADTIREKAFHGVKHLFYPTEQEDVDYGVPKEPAERRSRRREEGGDEQTVPAGQRAEQWFERINRKVRENTKRSRQNYNRLERLDFRSVWIARLLLGVFVTVLGGVILNIVLMT